MQSVRLAARRAPILRRSLATAGAVHPSSTATSSAVIPLSNIEAQWEKLPAEERAQVHNQLEEIQKKDWKTLSVDEKKAAYYVAFGPHGPRTPANPPGSTAKLLLGVTGSLAATAVLFYSIRAAAPPPPKTLTKEWEEAATQRAKEMKINPIHGVAAEDYKGSGFVTRS
jgi:cytochrome c oxidase subunit 4